MKFKSLLTIIISAALFFSVNLVYSADNGNIDVVLVMDSSGSMKKTDPQSLRIPAAKLFISLLKDGDRASVISFSGEGETLINLTAVDSRNNKEKLFTAAEKITSRGRYTNLYGALTKGMEVLSENTSEGRTQIIILMSDGMMDVGDPVEDSSLVESIRSELSVTLEESGIKVYTIAFTENSDRVLLERISKRTGGFYNLTLSDHDFHVVFTSIFESLKSPEMLPMSKNGFTVDNSVEEVTIVATKGSSDTQIMLNGPDRRSYTRDNIKVGIEWFPSNKFDMITIKNPSGGRWEILFSTGENNKAYIITDLKLKTNFEKMYSTYGEPRDVQVWLEKEGKTLNEKEVLDKIEFIMELTDPEGRTTRLKPFNKGDGTYVRSIAPFSQGNYTLKVIARGMTFERAKDFVFNVADVEESKEDVKHDREKKLKQEARLQKEQAEQMAKKLAALEASLQKEKSEKITWGQVIIYFIAINLVMGLGMLFFIKIRKSKKFKPLKLKGKTEDKQQGAEQAQDKDEGHAVKEEERPEKAQEPKAEAEPETQDNTKEETTPEAATEEPAQAQASDTQSNEQETETEPTEEPDISSEKEIALDDIDTDTMENVAETEPVEENTEAQAENKEVSPEDAPSDDAEAEAAETAPDTAVGTEEEQADTGNLISQDDLDSLLAGAPEREPTPEEAPESPGIKEEVDTQDMSSNAPQDTEEVQKDAEGEVSAETNVKEPEVKTETEDPEEKAPETKAEAAEELVSEEAKDEENVDDMWAEAFKEAEGEKEPEQNAEAEEPEEKAPEAKAEAAEELVSEEAKDEENIDDMWAEAFKEAEGEKEPEQKAEAEAPEEKAPEASVEKSGQSNATSAIKKPDIIENKQTTGEDPIDN
jgi:hypothetical protein